MLENQRSPLRVRLLAMCRGEPSAVCLDIVLTCIARNVSLLFPLFFVSFFHFTIGIFHLCILFMFLFSPGTVTVMVSMYLAIVIFCKYAYVRCEVTDNKLCEISRNWTGLGDIRLFSWTFLDSVYIREYTETYWEPIQTFKIVLLANRWLF